MGENSFADQYALDRIEELKDKIAALENDLTALGRANKLMVDAMVVLHENAEARDQKISELEAKIASKDAAIVATDKYFKALAEAWARNEGRLVSEIGTVIRGNEGIDKLCEDAAELVIKNLPAPEVGS